MADDQDSKIQCELCKKVIAEAIVLAAGKKCDDFSKSLEKACKDVVCLAFPKYCDTICKELGKKVDKYCKEHGVAWIKKNKKVIAEEVCKLAKVCK